MTQRAATFLVRLHVMTRPTCSGALYSVAARMRHTLQLVLFRTQVRDNVSSSSQTICTPQCPERRTNTCAFIINAVAMTAATSIMERTVQTTAQDCIHTVSQGFGTFHSRLLTPCSSAGHLQERSLLEFAARRSAGSYTPKSRSINLIRTLPRQQRFSLDLEARHFHHAIGKTPKAPLHLVNCGGERSTPPVEPTILPIYPKNNKFVTAPHRHQQHDARRDETPERQ